MCCMLALMICSLFPYDNVKIDCRRSLDVMLAVASSKSGVSSGGPALARFPAVVLHEDPQLYSTILSLTMRTMPHAYRAW